MNEKTDSEKDTILESPTSSVTEASGRPGRTWKGDVEAASEIITAMRIGDLSPEEADNAWFAHRFGAAS